MKKTLYLLPALACLVLASSCKQTAALPNTLSSSEQKDGWQLLFDGKTFNGWHSYNQKKVNGSEIANGEITVLGAPAPQGVSNDLITDQEYENFELSVEWKMSAGGNSGILYNIVESPKETVPYATGPEYQLIDDKGYADPLTAKQKTGANYDMHAPTRLASKPIGEFNHTRIVVNKGHVEHYLNGYKVVEYDLWTPEWETLVKGSKWKDFPGYGRAKRGRIGFQDHGHKVTFRNVKIRQL